VTGPTRASRTEPSRDDALLFDLLAVWAPDEAMRKRILVDNPENLYGFAKAA
jgi:D-galactarolactone isomerase